jgi:hypothetical protein
MNENDPLTRGQWLGEQFSLHVLDVPGPPMVHATRSFRPEIVLFGKEHQFQLPMMLDAGKSILVNGQGDKVTISRFAPGAEPEQRVISTDVADVIRTIVDLGGTYPDVVQALHQAKVDGALASRFEIDALPEAGRPYDRGPAPAPLDEAPTTSPASNMPLEVASPQPELFTR